MRFKIFIPAALIVAITIFSCSKSSLNDGCFTDAAIVRTIENKHATIQVAGSQYYLIEEGTIDTRLHPCTLPIDMRINGQQVSISGDVKATVNNDMAPCCTENFVITKIAKR